MPDATGSYRRRYNHRHPTARRARDECRKRSDGICQGCGDEQATEGHHWTYPPEEKTTARHLTAFCGYCHHLVTWFIWFRSHGGSRELLRDLFPLFVASLLERRDRPELKRIGRARRVRHAWGAVVSGGSRPHAGEVIAILLRCSREWRDFVVVDVVDGRPGSWQVLTRQLRNRDDVRRMCVTDLMQRHDPR